MQQIDELLRNEGIDIDTLNTQAEALDPFTLEDVQTFRAILDEFFMSAQVVSLGRLPAKESASGYVYSSFTIAGLGFFDFPSLREMLSYLFPFFDAQSSNPDFTREFRPYSFYGFIKQGFNFINKPLNERAQKREYADFSGVYTIRYVDSLIKESMRAIVDADEALLDGILRLGLSDVALRLNIRTQDLYKQMIETALTLEDDIFTAIISAQEDGEFAQTAEKLEQVESQFTEKQESGWFIPRIEFTALSGKRPGEVILKWMAYGASFCTGYDFGVSGLTRLEPQGELAVTVFEKQLFELTCWGKSGPSSFKLTISPPVANNKPIDAGPSYEISPQITIPSAPPPIIKLSAVSNFTGRESTLTWESEHTTSCVGENFDTKGATDGSIVVTQNENTTYFITCSGAGGSRIAATHINVLSDEELPKNPTISVKKIKGNSILSWTAPVVPCKISGTDGFLYTTASTTGTVSAGTLVADVKYTITCEVSR